MFIVSILCARYCLVLCKCVSICAHVCLYMYACTCRYKHRCVYMCTCEKVQAPRVPKGLGSSLKGSEDSLPLCRWNGGMCVCPVSMCAGGISLGRRSLLRRGSRHHKNSDGPLWCVRVAAKGEAQDSAETMPGTQKRGERDWLVGWLILLGREKDRGKMNTSSLGTKCLPLGYQHFLKQ